MAKIVAHRFWPLAIAAVCGTLVLWLKAGAGARAALAIGLFGAALGVVHKLSTHFTAPPPYVSAHPFTRTIYYVVWAVALPAVAVLTTPPWESMFLAPVVWWLVVVACVEAAVVASKNPFLRNEMIQYGLPFAPWVALQLAMAIHTAYIAMTGYWEDTSSSHPTANIDARWVVCLAVTGALVYAYARVFRPGPDRWRQLSASLAILQAAVFGVAMLVSEGRWFDAVFGRLGLSLSGTSLTAQAVVIAVSLGWWLSVRETGSTANA